MLTYSILESHMETIPRRRKNRQSPGTGLMALSARDYAKVLRTMRNPPKPNAAMMRAFAAYKEQCPERYKEIMERVSNR